MSFLEAFRARDVDAVRQYIANGITDKDIPEVEILLNSDYFLDPKGVEVFTMTLNAGLYVGRAKALVSAIKAYRPEIVELLIKHGENVNADGGIALKYAIASGQTYIIGLLLAAGAKQI